MVYRFDRFEVDDAELRLTRDGAPLVLEPKALRLLLYLVERPGRLIRKQELLDAVWPDTTVGENALTRGIALIRKALDDSRREPRYVETVPTAGYRFLAAVERVERAAAEPPEAMAAAVREKPVENAGSGVRWGVVMWVAGGAVLLAGLTLAGLRVRERQAGGATIRSIAVLPFENLSGDSAQEYFADGTTDELITELARIPGLRVLSRSSSMGEKGRRRGLRTIGNELGVEAVVEGSVARSGDRVRINAQLLEVEGDQHLWASSFEGSVADVVGLEDRIAEEVALHARLALVPQRARGAAKPVNAAAHDAYLRGLYFYDQRNVVKSAEYFKRATDLDPTYAAAYAGYAEALVSQGFFAPVTEELIANARAAGHKAVELEPENGEGYLALGSLETPLGWDWRAAESNLTRGLQLSPGDPVGRMWYAVYLELMGRTAEGVVEMRRALDDDPLSFFMTRQYAAVLYMDRRPDEALEQLKRAAEMRPELYEVVENWISWSYELKLMYPEAVAHDLLQSRADRSAAEQTRLWAEFERKGWKAYWEARLKEMHPAESRGCDLYLAGIAYARVGERDEAFAALQRAIEQRCFWMTMLQVDPKVDGLRGDPRFAGLLRAVNLPAPGENAAGAGVVQAMGRRKP